MASNLLNMSLRDELIYAVTLEDNETVSNVLDKMTAHEVNENRSIYGTLSALEVACLHNNIQAMNLLLAKPGIDVNAKHRHGDTVLALACSQDNYMVVILLLATPDIDQNAKNDNGLTPIFRTAEKCNIKTLEAMLQSPHIDLDIKCHRGLGLEDYVGGKSGTEEERKKCLDMIREEKLRRMKVSENEDSKGTEIEKTKRMILEEGDNNCGVDTKRITKDEHPIDAKDNSEVVSSTKKSLDPATTETPSVKFARIVFDATDLGKGFKTLRLNAATPMMQIKKLFPKHLGLDEETFMLCFNNLEVKEETPLELFGCDIDGDDNLISIVKAVAEERGACCAKIESSDPKKETDQIESSDPEKETDQIESSDPEKETDQVESSDPEKETDQIESSDPEKETDHVLASNAENGKKEVTEVKRANRISFKWLGSKMTSQYIQPVRIKPKCIRASCLNQGQHRCDRCKAVYYCKQDCLSEDWYNHKVHCDYVYEASKDYAYEGNRVPDDSAYEGNCVPDDSANEDPEQTGNSGDTGGTVEVVD